VDTQRKIKMGSSLRSRAHASLFSAVIVAALCSFSAAQNSSAAVKPDSSSGNAENGKRLYTSYGCYECHGRQAQGSRTSGPRLAPNPIALSAIEKYVRQPKGQMPPYTSKVVSDGDLRDIYAFLKSLPQPPPVSSIPLLN
jgi:ubiquinol-cytochrome c reductase cytochrome c subunit